MESVTGFLPASPRQLLAQSSDIVSIPTIRGYTTHEMSYLVRDPEDDGITLSEFRSTLKKHLSIIVGSSEKVDEIVAAAEKTYLGGSAAASKARPLDLRAALIEIYKDVLFVVPTMAETVAFSKGCSPHANGSNSYIYEFAYRPSYSRWKPWMGVVHADEKGFVLGLPQGPDPFEYSSANDLDREVADDVVSLWTNFAKYGNHTSSSVTWLPYMHARKCVTKATDEPDVGRGRGHLGSILVINDMLEVKSFDRGDKATFRTSTVSAILDGGHSS